MMSEEQNKCDLIVFTHNDLDALGSMLNIEFATPNSKKAYFHTNYSNIPKIVDDILSYSDLTGCNKLFISDVSFSGNKESLIRLYDHFKDGKIVHIDHHLYPDGFWGDLPKMRVVWDKSKSATMLCNETLKNKGKNKQLDSLSAVIDVYDIWQKNEPLFSFSQDLNSYFWTKNIKWLFETIVSRGYKLPEDFRVVVSGIHKIEELEINEYEKRGCIKRSGPMTVAFVDYHFNKIMISEMEKGVDIVIGVTSYGTIRVRIREEAPFSDEQKGKLKLVLTGLADNGHMNAFTYKVASNTETIYKEVSNLANTIGKIFYENL